MASVSMSSTVLPASLPNHHDPSVAAEVSTPIEVTGAEGLRAAEVRIQFDPSEVTTDAAHIRSGSLWGGQAAVIANVDQSAGTIVAFVFSARPVTTGDGELIDIHFTPQPNAQHDGPIVIDVQKVRLNEGRISLTNDPVVGPDASDGRIHVGLTDVTDNAPRRARGSFVADPTAIEENCRAVADPPQSHGDSENTSPRRPQLRRPSMDVHGPLAPQAVDSALEDMSDSRPTPKHDFNVRATWHSR